MMLRLEGLSPGATPEVIIDQYVPLTIKWAGEFAAPAYYCRIGDFEHSLAEFKIDSSTGLLRQFTLILPGPEVYEGQPNGTVAPTRKGVPVIDRGGWNPIGNSASRSIIDVQARILVFLSDQSISVIIGDEKRSTEIESGRVTIGLDKSNIVVSVEVALTASERNQLSAAIHREGVREMGG
jgi:hypothetical protein